jgi:hypothetical protein
VILRASQSGTTLNLTTPNFSILLTQRTEITFEGVWDVYEELHQLYEVVEFHPPIFMAYLERVPGNWSVVYGMMERDLNLIYYVYAQAFCLPTLWMNERT